jgi:hypothetical protein
MATKLQVLPGKQQSWKPLVLSEEDLLFWEDCNQREPFSSAVRTLKNFRKTGTKVRVIWQTKGYISVHPLREGPPVKAIRKRAPLSL